MLMATLFFDSSALVKRYVEEIGSSWVGDLCEAAAGNTLYVVQLTVVETVSAITRRSRRGELSPEETEAAATALFQHFNGDYREAQVSPGLIEVAVDMARRHGLRAYDAVQLAAALHVKAERDALGLPALMFLSADNALNAAAVAERLTVDNPNDHP